jgi:hypothetical protein
MHQEAPGGHPGVLLSPQLCLMAVCEDSRDAQRKLHIMK